MLKSPVYIKPRTATNLKNFIASSKLEISETIGIFIGSVVNQNVIVKMTSDNSDIPHRNVSTEQQTFFEISVAPSGRPGIMTVSIAAQECRQLCALAFGLLEERDSEATTALTQFERSFCLLLLSGIARQLAEILSQRLDITFTVEAALTQRSAKPEEQLSADVMKIEFYVSIPGREYPFFVVLNSRALEKSFESHSLSAQSESAVSDWRQALLASVGEIPMTVSALIRLSLEARDIARVQPGRVIPLPASSWRKATLLVDQFDAYHGEIGRDQDQVTFRLS